MHLVLRILTVMSKGENPAQSISFLWSPYVYPFAWADTPDEVPEWDASRKPQAYAGDSYDMFPGMRDETVLESPSEYPRLVCVDRNRKLVSAGEESGPEELINELLALYPYIRPWYSGKPVKVLRDKVLALANRYGAPYRREDNTLKAWLCLAAVVHGYMLGYELLQKLEYEGMQAELNDILDPVLKAIKDRPRRTKPFVFTNEGASPAEMELTVLSYLRFLGGAYETRETRLSPWSVVVGNNNLSYRLGIAEHLHGMFGRAFDRDHPMSPNLLVTSQAIFAQCSVSSWAYYRLAQVWRHGAEVRKCPVCGTLFAPARKNMRYCKRGTCAYKAHKQNQKARAAQSQKTLSTTA